MRLGAKQELFAELIAEHIIWLYDEGYKIRIGDVWAKDGHKENSLHYDKLAADLNLFKDGEYLTETRDHRASGARWEQRHELCRWGGRYDDGNHYEIMHGGR